MPVFGLSEMAHASCVSPGQEAAIAAAQQAETSSPVVVEIEACGGDDISYQIPLSVDVTFDGQVYENVYVTTNSVITFGRPDGTYWDYPQTPSISLYSMDWVIYPQWREDEHLIIATSDGGFQVDISARPIWLGENQTDPTNITITAAILSDGTVAMAYTIDGPTYDDQTRTGVRLTDGSIVTLDEYGIEQLTESPTLAPEPTTESPFVPEPTPEPTPTISPQPEPSPDPSESPTISPQPEPTESPSPETPPTTSPEPTVSPTPEPTPSESPSPEPEQPQPTPPFIPEGSTVYSEGQVAEIIAPEGQRIASILGYYGDPSDSRNGQDVSPTLAQFAGSQSAIIQANNELFGDPAPGVVKIMILLVTYESIPVTEPTDTQSPEPTSSPEPQPTTSPEAPQTTPTPEPTATEQPSIDPIPVPEPQPEPTPEVTPEPTPSPEETVDPIEPEPTPTTQPEEEVQEEVVEPEQPQPEETLTPEPTPVPEPEEVHTIDPEPTPTQTPESTPSEKPEPIIPEKPVEVEIKEEISAENIESLVQELAEIQPQLLTEEQQTLIVAAAIEVFAEAEQGSPEYEAALDALLVVAQADDIVLDEELAAIPLIGNVAGAAVEVFNALGNAGADMSPQVREQSEKVVIAAVIVGQVAMTATAAATSAAAAAARRP